MAQMLQDRFSSEKHLEITNRHIRLCHRNPGAAFLVTDIQPSVDELQKATDTTVAKGKERAYAYDAVMYCDGGLDCVIQNVFDACKKCDRESGSAPILASVFPTEKVSDIKDAPLMQEPLYARELLERLKALGSTHILAALIPALEEKITVSEKAIEVYDNIGKELAMVGIQEEISQRKLRDQYQLNILHAQEKLGKTNAGLLFPDITKNPKPIVAPVITQSLQPATL